MADWIKEEDQMISLHLENDCCLRVGPIEFRFWQYYRSLAISVNVDFDRLNKRIWFKFLFYGFEIRYAG